MKKSYYPKIIVFGIDGLEFSLVKKWKLQNIMQKKHSKLDLSDYKVIVTPPIWGSMLTGKINDEIMEMWVKQAQISGLGINTKQKWWAKIGNILPPFLDLWIWYNIFAPLFGGDLFVKTANYIVDRNETNIFQFFQKPWTNGIPSYGRIVNNPKRKYEFQMAMYGNDTKFKENIIKIYKEDKKKLFSALNKNTYDIIFWYTVILDKIGHIYYKDTLTLMKYYFEINQLVGQIKTKFPKSHFYIISDHGMIKVKGGWGLHSKYAFFSSNTGEIIKKPYDLYNLILKHKTI
ncbi:MAG: hypothetical protein AYK22_00020 [Thermoplasmatales archaeon SG8-52-3]|nr:MAG: hypothetical protein AYK22_00020 [Thermoplasmatales archaeon SG8-52-3]